VRASIVLLALACGEPKTAPETSAPPADPTPAPAPAPAPATPAGPEKIGELTITPLYHSTLALETGGKTWIVDPWSKAPLENRKADVILITDVHYDHLDQAAIDIVKKDGTIVVGPAAVAEKTKVDVVLANGETKEVAGVKLTAVPMYNLQRGPEPGKLFHDKGRGNGYVVEAGGVRAYIAGDTECIDEMRALTNIDVAFVPMNLPYTMTPDEAAVCIKAFAPKVVYPFHYNDSDLSGLAAAVGPSTEVRLREWYPGGLP
jgi:L-ascorbate metabolism protein UlaG (beta-lactamase superfamily)